MTIGRAADAAAGIAQTMTTTPEDQTLPSLRQQIGYAGRIEKRARDTFRIEPAGG